MGIPGLRGLNPFQLFYRTVKYYLSNDMLTYSEALAFRALFSVFPFLIVMVAFMGLFDLMQFFDWLRYQASVILPDEALAPLDRVITEVQQPRGGLFSIGLIFTLWFASGAMRSTINALNAVYKVKEGRPFWKLYPLSIVYTIGVAVMLVSAAVLMVLGPQTMDWLAERVGFEDFFVTIWTWIRFPLAFFLMMLTVALVYYVAPDVEQRLRFITPGSVFTVIVWIAGSIGFRYYVQNFADYSAVYGSIGTIIVLMMYFYISSAVLLFGAEINAVVEDHVPSGKNLGEKKFS